MAGRYLCGARKSMTMNGLIIAWLVGFIGLRLARANRRREQKRQYQQRVFATHFGRDEK
jgi:hypothetical protein